MSEPDWLRPDERLLLEVYVDRGDDKSAYAAIELFEERLIETRRKLAEVSYNLARISVAFGLPSTHTPDPEYVKKLMAQLAELREQTRWRDPAVELPEDGETVIVEADDGEVDAGYSLSDRWWRIGPSEKGIRVTGWMPLPKPRSER